MRHGETDWNSAGRFCGWSDPPLSERGRAQARELRRFLVDQRFDSFVSSPSVRALETARLAYGEPILDDRLRELDFGDMEGSTWADCSPELQERLGDFESFEAPNGESVAKLSERVEGALRALGSGRHLVVTHGGVVRFLLGRAGVAAYPGVASITRIRLTVSVGGLEAALAEDVDRSFA